MADYLIDTSIWIDFFRGKLISPLLEILQQDIPKDKIGITDIIRHEILVGARNNTDYQNLQKLLNPLACYRISDSELPFFERFAWKLQKQGLKGKYTDVSIAYLCSERNLPLLTFDAYFDALDRRKILRTIKI